MSLTGEEIFGLIETLEQWNDALGECNTCCWIPEPCGVQIECQTLEVSGVTYGFRPFYDNTGSGSLGPSSPIASLYRKAEEREYSTGTGTYSFSTNDQHRTSGVVDSTIVTTTTESYNWTQGYNTSQAESCAFGGYTTDRYDLWECAADPPSCGCIDTVIYSYTYDYSFYSSVTEDDTVEEPNSSNTDTEHHEKTETIVFGDPDLSDSDLTSTCHVETAITVTPEGTPFEGNPILCSTLDSSTTLWTITDTNVTRTITEVYSCADADAGDWSPPDPATSQSKSSYSLSAGETLVYNDYVTLSEPFTKADAMSEGRSYRDALWAVYDSICNPTSSNSTSVDDECSRLTPNCFSVCSAETTCSWPTGYQAGTTLNPTTGSVTLVDRVFRYRWKLPKCCLEQSGSETIDATSSRVRLEWDEVYFPKAYNDWLAGHGGDPPSGSTPPVSPTVTHKVWEYVGTPDNCRTSESSDDPDAIGWPADNYDDETMWSPWSLAVTVPLGEEGTVELRNLMIDHFPDNPFGSVPVYLTSITDRYDGSEFF